jgi:RimJ/RimL family protein N-acetyltransferase
MLTVREIQHQDIKPITDYWYNASAEYLNSMGADINKFPDRSQWEAMLELQLTQSYPEKLAYCIILEKDGNAIGHTNTNKIVFGQEAYMHLHIWQPENRQTGYGEQLIKMALPYFFKNLQLKNLYCEPYALNPAPNKTLEKIGFEFVKEYVTTPGHINFEQPVKLWLLSAEKFNKEVAIKNAAQKV